MTRINSFYSKTGYLSASWFKT